MPLQLHPTIPLYRRSEAINGTSFDRHGLLRLSENRRHLAHADGTPFFWLGDTAWPLFTQYSRQEAEIYLENRAKKGFTIIQGVLTWFGGDRPDPSGMSSNWKGEYPWLNKDPAHPNPAFFEHVDDLLSLAQNLDLTLAILPTWGNYVTDLHLFTAESARQYGTWLGSRYRDRPNIVWINGGDCLPQVLRPSLMPWLKGCAQGMVAGI